MNEQSKFHMYHKGVLRLTDSLISSSHLIKDLSLITQLTTEDPITLT